MWSIFCEKGYISQAYSRVHPQCYNYVQCSTVSYDFVINMACDFLSTPLHHSKLYDAESCNPGAAKKGQRPLGGMGFQAAPLEVFPAHDVELKYSLQFDESFQPQKGGKLPGLMMAEAGDCKGGTLCMSMHVFLRFFFTCTHNHLQLPASHQCRT